MLTLDDIINNMQFCCTNIRQLIISKEKQIFSESEFLNVFAITMTDLGLYLESCWQNFAKPDFFFNGLMQKRKEIDSKLVQFGLHLLQILCI